MLKKYAFILAITATIVLAIVSLVNINSIPETGLSFEDKLFHFIAYAMFTIIWFYALINNRVKLKKDSTIVVAVLIAVIYGIIIEVIQGQFTTNRVMEFNDIIANILGALFAGLMIKLKVNSVKKQ